MCLSIEKLMPCTRRRLRQGSVAVKVGRSALPSTFEGVRTTDNSETDTRYTDENALSMAFAIEASETGGRLDCLFRLDSEVKNLEAAQ